MVAESLRVGILLGVVLVPDHEAGEHAVLGRLVGAQDLAGDRSVHVASTSSSRATGKTDMELGMLAGGARQVRFPLSIVEAIVVVAVSVEYSALFVVVELNP